MGACKVRLIQECITGETYLSAHLQLYYLNPICYDRGLVALVEGRLEHLDGIGVELVGEARPFEGE